MKYRFNRTRSRSASVSHRLAWLTASVAALLPAVNAGNIMVEIRNLAPASGTYLTPFWVGLHSGAFDLFDAGSTASPGLERLAEDGNTAVVSAEFTASGHGSQQGTLVSGGAIPPFAPGDTGSLVFLSVNPFDPTSRYLSFASMVIPSNDAFIGNGNPMMIQVFDALGAFVGGTFTLYGSMVYDAGTEMNDEVPANTAFFGQAAPDTGVVEGGTVALHVGFKPIGSGGILDDSMFAGADFTQGQYALAEIKITSVVPEPHEYAALAAAGLLGFAGWRRWWRS